MPIDMTTPISDVTVNGDSIPLAGSGGEPIEVATALEMDALLVAANVGKVYRFTGTTDVNYTNGDLYEVEEVV